MFGGDADSDGDEDVFSNMKDNTGDTVAGTAAAAAAVRQNDADERYEKALFSPGSLYGTRMAGYNNGRKTVKRSVVYD
ncbi:MAG: hypothetical protein PHY64_09055 [Eubacteriales bacterium]|nr:hypothetical protein [Eubacteriales bacterium]